MDYEQLGHILESIHPGVTIADSNGVFRFVSNSYLSGRSVKGSDIIGKFAGSEEMMKMFSPCVTQMVFESHKRVTTVQKGVDNDETFVTGIPVFKDGELEMIISYSSWEITGFDDLRERYEEAMNDDLNSPLVIAALFDWVRIINQIYEKQQSITAEDLDRLRVLVHTVVFDVLGLCDEKAAEADDLVTPLVEMLLDVRAEAKAAKNWAASDRIRDRLNEIGIRVKDRKDGCDWEIE